MEWYCIILIILIPIILLVCITSYICYLRTFHSKIDKSDNEDVTLPDGEIFNKYKDIIFEDIKYAKTLNYKLMSVKSFDGLTLYGKYYESIKGAPIEIMFHGYKGSSLSVLSSII